MTLKEYYKKHRSAVLYLLFALGTAVFDWGTYIIYALIVGTEGMSNYLCVMAGNALAWFIAVTFAFITNKLFVFKSKKKGAKQLLLKEIPLFYGSRLVTLGVTEGGVAIIMAIFGKRALTLGTVTVSSHWVAKLIMSLVGIAINYAFGKFLVFRKKNTEVGSKDSAENLKEPSNKDGLNDLKNK